MKKFIVDEAKMTMENGDKVDQIFRTDKTSLEDFVQYICRVCGRDKRRVSLRVRGLYGSVGFVLEVYFPFGLNEYVQIRFDSDVCVDVDDYTERDFCANTWYGIDYTSAREEKRNTAGFGSGLYEDKEDKKVKEAIEDKKNVRSYNVGPSDYAKHAIQPWDIWREYNLNPWDADIVKRVLRTKETDGRKLDYEKIIHICKERIRQIDEYGK